MRSSKRQCCHVCVCMGGRETHIIGSSSVSANLYLCVYVFLYVNVKVRSAGQVNSAKLAVWKPVQSCSQLLFHHIKQHPLLKTWPRLSSLLDPRILQRKKKKSPKALAEHMFCLCRENCKKSALWGKVSLSLSASMSERQWVQHVGLLNACLSVFKQLDF